MSKVGGNSIGLKSEEVCRGGSDLAALILGLERMCPGVPLCQVITNKLKLDSVEQANRKRFTGMNDVFHKIFQILSK